MRYPSIVVVGLTLAACGTQSPGAVLDSGTGGLTTNHVTGQTEASADEASGGVLDIFNGAEPKECEPANADFTYIWIANSAEGTVSKVDTRTLTEQGRYRTMPAGGDPSRTSVNLVGDVAVADRAGGVTKIAVRDEDCVESNGIDGLQTSNGADDVLEWGDDECVVWHRPLEPGARAVAWTAGIGHSTCSGSSPPGLWVSAPSTVDEGADVFLLDGATGDVLGQAAVPGPFTRKSDTDAGATTKVGLYGAAVDSANDLWAIGWRSTQLVRVGFEGLDVTQFEYPGEWSYGIAVDAQGRPWVGGRGSVIRFDPTDETWTEVDLTAQGYTGLSRGMMEDADGNLWVAASPADGPGFGVLRIDTDTATFVDFIDTTMIPEMQWPAGVSIDVDGFVWMVDQEAEGAVKIDPASLDYEWVYGFDRPYTYSDMTGWGLLNVYVPEG